MIASISFIKNILDSQDLKAKKKFGQNFLIDANIVDKIAQNACNINETTIEIGPGLGSLTEMLLKYSKNVDAYEIDKDMFNLLKQNITNDNLNIYLEDFLDTDLDKYKGQNINVCSNLPYYVTTPILFKLFEADLNLTKITVMVQKEVADRFKAPINSEDYNALSIIVQYLFNVKQEMFVPKNVFYPAPKVDSAVISFTPKIIRNKEYEKGLFDFIERCFMKRRKTLSNNLKEFLNNEQIEKIYQKNNLNMNVRAQELSLDQYIQMYEVIR